MTDVICEFKKMHRENIVITIPHFELCAGEKVGISGKSGSGKTTLFHVMLGLIEYEGDVRVDGNDIDDYAIDNQDFMIISNDDPLFNLSVKENLLMGNEVRDSLFNKVIKGTQVSSFITDFDQKIGDTGTNFSAGQMQRLRLARGLLQDAQIYLMDEPFNGIDEKTKDDIMKFIKEYMKDKSLIIISHHDEEIDFTDTRYRMENQTLKKA